MLYREEQEHDPLTEAAEIIFYELTKLEQRVRDYLACLRSLRPRMMAATQKP